MGGMFLQKILQHIRDAVFPQQCVYCGTFDTVLCKQCATSALHIQQQQFSLSDNTVVAIHTLGQYAHPVWRKIVKDLKFSGVKSAGLILGELLAEQFPLKNAVVIPIPLHKRRLRERGYNQAELIAQAYAKRLNLPVQHLITRSKITKAQSVLQAQDRLPNMNQAFSVSSRTYVPPNTPIILVDDVITSGATILAAIQTIEDLQPARIDVIAIARSHDFSQ